MSPEEKRAYAESEARRICRDIEPLIAEAIVGLSAEIREALERVPYQ